MSNSSANIYLVAGATRGIGLALVAEIAEKDPSAIIYAGGRNPSGSSQLVEIASKYPGRVELVKYVAADKAGNEAIAKEIGRSMVTLTRLGIANPLGKVHETTVENYEEHFSVNVLGPIVLFQAFRDLLKASALPRFIAVSSGAGSIGMMDMIPMDMSSYGTSKVALNWVVRKIHFENDWLIAYPQCPGAVDTDMGAVTTGQREEFVKHFTLRQPHEAASILVGIIRESTREKDGGQFHNIDGGRYLW
ncbi:NAD(P)-binding protein [Pholiota conissans]|uniref:NAD(P)-binding protein n=1 Tax=Pholiota conissans TaxID=109636 RepID=A0A9P5YLS7_9AGAR|nr:NAD(P)-binding protein [Pholiota conissans]